MRNRKNSGINESIEQPTQSLLARECDSSLNSFRRKGWTQAAQAIMTRECAEFCGLPAGCCRLLILPDRWAFFTRTSRNSSGEPADKWDMREDDSGSDIPVRHSVGGAKTIVEGRDHPGTVRTRPGRRLSRSELHRRNPAFVRPSNCGCSGFWNKPQLYSLAKPNSNAKSSGKFAFSACNLVDAVQIRDVFLHRATLFFLKAMFPRWAADAAETPASAGAFGVFRERTHSTQFKMCSISPSGLS